MFVVLEDAQREEICSEIEKLFAIPSVKDGSCGMFTMPESLIKDRADHFNSCIETVYDRIHGDNELIGMYEIVSTLDTQYDLGYLVKNVFNENILSKICEQLVDCKGFKLTEAKIKDSTLSDELKEMLLNKLREEDGKTCNQ